MQVFVHSGAQRGGPHCTAWLPAGRAAALSRVWPRNRAWKQQENQPSLGCPDLSFSMASATFEVTVLSLSDQQPCSQHTCADMAVALSPSVAIQSLGLVFCSTTWPTPPLSQLASRERGMAALEEDGKDLRREGERETNSDVKQSSQQDPQDAAPDIKVLGTPSLPVGQTGRD